MDRKSVSVVSGLLLVAALQFRPVPPSPKAGSNLSSENVVSAETTKSGGGKDGLPRNEDGPWSAICRYFAVLERPGEAESKVEKEEYEEPGAKKEEYDEPGVKKEEYEDALERRKSKGNEVTRYKLGKKVSANLGTCLPSSKQPYQIKAMIATVPDPVNSHRVLQYDRALEAIERAVSSASYTFDRYWIPWDEVYSLPQSDPDKLAAIDEKRHRREEQPGVLLFRKSENDLLAVFLVGETPTSGINKIAFVHAVEYSNTLHSLSVGSRGNDIGDDSDLLGA
jgi:hypothetical protein